MYKNIIFYLSTVVALVGLSVQNLNKPALLSGLGGLDFSFLRASTSPAGPGVDRNLCHCTGASPQDVLNVTYQGSIGHRLVLCMCPKAVTCTSYMTEIVRRIDHFYRMYLEPRAFFVCVFSTSILLIKSKYLAYDVTVYC
jgi:hypothetical protein